MWRRYGRRDGKRVEGNEDENNADLVVDNAAGNERGGNTTRDVVSRT